MVDDFHSVRQRSMGPMRRPSGLEREVEGREGGKEGRREGRRRTSPCVNPFVKISNHVSFQEIAFQIRIWRNSAD